MSGGGSRGLGASWGQFGVFGRLCPPPIEAPTPRHWELLADAASFARLHAEVLRDAHWIGGDPSHGEPYGVASFGRLPTMLSGEAEGDLSGDGGLHFWRSAPSHRALGGPSCSACHTTQDSFREFGLEEAHVAPP